MDNTERKDGGPAYPRPYSTDGSAEDGPEEGMSLRDAFAIAGLGCIEINADPGVAGIEFAPLVAAHAYAIADAMLEERDR